MDHTVVFTDHTFDDLEIEREILEQAGASVVDGEASDEPLESLVADADALIVMYEEIDESVFEAMPGCRVVSRTGIGVDNVDVDAATERGVYVTNVPDYCISEVSDHAMALMLALQRNVVTYTEQTHRGEWDVTAGNEMRRLTEQTLGLVAFGKTAREVGRKADALGMEVLAWDPYLSEEEIREGGVSPVGELDELLDRVDVLSVHPPLTPETEGLIGSEAFERLAESAYVLNVARGGIIDEAALAEALESGAIAGAGIDVLSEEPPDSGHPLVGRDDVILTPHAAWNSRESLRELRRKAAENVRAVLAGETPPYSINGDEIA